MRSIHHHRRRTDPPPPYDRWRFADQLEIQDLLNRAPLFHGLSILFMPPEPGQRQCALDALRTRDDHLLPDERTPWRRALAQARRAWELADDTDLPARYRCWSTPRRLSSPLDVHLDREELYWMASRLTSDELKRLALDDGQDPHPARSELIPDGFDRYGRLLIQEAHGRARDWAAGLDLPWQATAELFCDEAHQWLWLLRTASQSPEAEPYARSAALAQDLLAAEGRRLGLWGEASTRRLLHEARELAAGSRQAIG